MKIAQRTTKDLRGVGLNTIVSLCLILIMGFSHIQFAHAKRPSTIRIDGSSTVFPITEAIAESFQKENKARIRVTVGISGTGGGFKKFCRGETDVQGASRPISKEEVEACRKSGVKYFELPIAYDATVVAVHPQNSWAKEISVEELKKTWEPAAQGKILKWNQIRPEWPDAPLKLYGAGADSGTFDYFTEAVVGKAKASRGDYTASEDDNTIIQGISSDKNALGYIPFAYYEPNQNRLKALSIKGGNKAPKKTAVAPTAESVEDGTYFPLARPLFIYVRESSLTRPEVRDFVEYYLTNSAPLVSEVKYIPLPSRAYAMAKERLKKGQLGTVFDGHAEVGLKIEDLLKREARQ
jgi:phosphate transport system substrate-binding protein